MSSNHNDTQNQSTKAKPNFSSKLFMEHILYCNILMFQMYACTYTGCQAIFKSKSGLYMHHNRHLGKYMYNCPYCDKGIHSTDMLKGHLKKYHTARTVLDLYVMTNMMHFK